MTWDDAVKQIQNQLEQRKPTFFLVENPNQLPHLFSALIQHKVSAVRLRPPLPWEPLAPLRHLCEHAGGQYPGWEESDALLPTLILGEAVRRTRFYLRVAEELYASPTVAFVSHEEMQAPLWGDFLRFLRNHGAFLPLCFVLHLPENAPPLPRAVPLPLQAPPGSPLDLKAKAAFGAELPKVLRSYLSQCLVFGDRYQPEAMKGVSRANHTQRLNELRAAGLFDFELQVVADRLASAGPLQLPKGVAWRRKALASLEEDRPAVRHWLRYHRQPVLKANKESQAQELWSAGQVLPLDQSLQRVPVPSSPSGQEAYLGACVLEASSLDATPSTLPTHKLRPPHQQLAHVFLGDLSHRKSLEDLQNWLEELVHMGANDEAGMVACRLARWHLGCGRVQAVFGLLKPYKASKPWAIRWLVETMYAEAFCQIHRMDLARSCVEQAVQAAPPPIAPPLVGELRLLTARLLLADGLAEEAQVQMSEARQLFLQSGEGVRLGRYFVRVGELHWKAERWDEARNTLSRGLNLFRRYNDGLGVQEAQLKLGLILRQAPFTTLFPS
ncbi:MAG: hypothetical protein EP343_27120 [Deltaproteobacteria bacterium]|nr:MAG: hypothetical protein EP343_27120 [Deltaproteobacteria bacterium]